MISYYGSKRSAFKSYYANSIVSSGSIISATVLGASAQYNGVNVGDGWWMQTTMPNVSIGGTYSLTPDTTAKISFIATRLGFDSSGNATSVNDTVVATQTIKQAYPNDALVQEQASGSNVITNFSLSEYLYAGESTSNGNVLSGAYTGLSAGSMSVTNGSSLTYPKVIADWVSPPKQDWSSTITLEVAAYHKFGRSAQPVACVKITGFDGTNTVTKTCTYQKSTLYSDNLPVFAATFNNTDFIAGSDVTFNFSAYPFVGDTNAVRTSSGSFPSVTTTAPIVHRNGLNANIKYAYVLTTGNNATAAVSTTRAGAKATAYLTIDAALAALFAANTNLSNSRLYIGAGTFNWPAANITGATRTAPDAFFVIEGDPDDADPKTNCIIQTVGTTYVQVFNNLTGTVSYLATKNLTLNIRAAMQGFFNANSQRGVFLAENCNINSAMTTNTTWLSSNVANWFISVNAQASASQLATLLANSGTNIKPALIRNCTSNRTLGANVIVSSTLNGGTGQVQVGNATNLRESNLIWAYSKLTDFNGTGAGLLLPLAASGTKYLDIAISTIVVDYNAANNQPLYAFGENSTESSENVLWEYVTTLGGSSEDAARVNVHNDPPTAQFPTTTVSPQASYKDFTMKNNLFRWVAVKDDRFSGANEGNTGASLVVKGWPKRYGIGFASDGSDHTLLWEPEYYGLNSTRNVARTFGANYKPTSGFPLVITQTQKWDLYGVLRRTDGTGAAGAVES